MTDAPYTGLTRDIWAATADGLLLALRPWVSPDHARIDLPGQPSAYGGDSDSLEAFARSFLLAGIRLHGEHGNDPHGLAEWYADGLRAGTDPASPNAWPRPDRLGQAKVEACSIALGLHLSRPWLWDRLGDPERERIVAWLATVVGEPYPPINWVWFQLVVETFLRSVGGPWSAEDIESGLAVHESLYRDHGWYADGPERAFDHYNGWALHVYPLLWATINPGVDAGLVSGWRDRLAQYLRTAVHLIGGNGSPLVQGRSLTYRFAAAAPLWMGALTGATDVPPGLLRRAASGMLAHFLDHDVPDDRGLLNLGWYGEWPRIAQSYSGPGSPYWAVKGMLGLMLPADHAVWTATEEPLPVETGDFTLEVPEPGWIVSGTQADGVVRIVNHGTDHSVPGDRRADSPLYARLGYSTHTMPPLDQEAWSRAIENSVAIVHPELGPSHRNGFTTVRTGVSVASAHWVRTDEDTGADHGSGRGGSVSEGPRIVVGSVLHGSHEVRAAVVSGDLDPSWQLEFSGWPLSAAEQPAETVDDHQAKVTATGLLSAVASGIDFEYGVRRLTEASPTGNHTAIPYARTRPAAGVVHTAVITLGGSPERAPVVSVEDDTIRVEWADGRVDHLPMGS
ncbi:DUF2264 domain-containing protein [Kribbella turkmenica]|uniref:DUF2264 domain-containing protein n=1 Tax=Kribbella turkmenica TaxID=2530375 RepID=A0A4R4WIS8_9ACTN|nr:DUF2264 domain-containing protein [Kribbella turkmenica]TDD16273.1 DUF2264 domain-containing protein [Kribbella turkmenica]